MSLRLLTELERRLDNWRETMNDDAARLRYYQRHLLEMRQFSPRPHNSVHLTLRQCAAARKMKRHAAPARWPPVSAISENCQVPPPNDSPNHQAAAVIKRPCGSASTRSPIPCPALILMPYSSVPQARAIWSGRYNSSMACHRNSPRPCSNSTCAAAKVAPPVTAASANICASAPSGCAVLSRRSQSTRSNCAMTKAASG